MRRCLLVGLLAAAGCAAGCAGEGRTAAGNRQFARPGAAAGPHAKPDAPSAGRAVPFAQRGECDMAAAVADIRGAELADWGTQEGPPDSLSLQRAWKIGKDAEEQPDVLVTVHSAGKEGPEVLRFYGIDGRKLMAQVELVSGWGPFEPLNSFKHRGREFIIAWGHSAGSAGGGPQWVLCKSGPRVRLVPYDSPAEKSRDLLAKGEAGGDWYLNEGTWGPAGVKPDGLSFAYYVWGPGDATASPRAKVTGTFALEPDSRTEALRFIFKDARRLDGAARHPYLKPEERPAKAREALDPAAGERERYDAIWGLAISGYCRQSAEALAIIACDSEVDVPNRWDAAMGLISFTCDMPEEVRRPIQDKLCAALETERETLPDGVIRTLIHWGQADRVRQALGEKLRGHPVEVAVLERISSREQAVARLWDIYQTAPPVRTYNVPLTLRWNVGAALLKWKDKRGVDILLECLTAKDLKDSTAASARLNRHSGFIWFVAALDNPCGDDISVARWSTQLDEKAIPKLAAWWKAHRETWEFKDTTPNGVPETDQRSE